MMNPLLRDARRPALTRIPLFLLSCLLILSLSSAAAAQNSVELEIVDPKGKKVAGATVVAMPEGGGSEITGAANKKGKYEAKLPPGNWTLVISSPGLGDTKVPVKIEEGMTQTAKITMVDEETARQQEAIDAFNMGVAKIQENDEAGALTAFRKAAEINPGLADAHRLVALLSAQTGDIDSAEAALAKFLEIAPDGLKDVAPAAYEVYRARGDETRLPAARQALRDIGAATDLASKVFNEGVGKARENDKAGAIALFNEAATLDPSLSPAFRSMAALHFNDQEYAETLEAVGNLLTLSPDHKEGLRMAFFSHFELDQFDQADEIGGRWIAAAPGASNEIVDTARKTFEGNNPSDARQLLQVVVTHDDEHALGHYMMGRVLAGSGEIPEAKKHLQRFLELSPNHPEAGDAKAMLEGL